MIKNKVNPVINIEEFVDINGIPQYLYHRGLKEDNPVLLFLHGGPGSVESIFAHLFQKKWEEIYTVVHWDQPGAGKTLMKNPKELPTIDNLVEDLFAIIQYLKKKYNKEKIVLLGHSWGSVLGTTFIKKYPDEIHYYIGVGQVVNMLENERVGYEKVKELIIEADDKKSLKLLESIGEYPGEKVDFTLLPKIGVIRKLQGKYKLAAKFNFSMIPAVMKSPIFKFSDISALFKGTIANRALVDYLGSYNLYAESLRFEMPIYFISGENDWQTPYILANEYLSKIDAPYKEMYLIHNASHMTMLDEPEAFYQVLKEICEKN